MLRTLTLLSTFALFLSTAWSQDRFLDAQFDVNVTADIEYAQNATKLFVADGMGARTVPLSLDLYEPVGDDGLGSPLRPLIVLAHTGLFLPPDNNGGCTGTRKDADIVNLGNRLAAHGYVVAAIQYRLGWNPAAMEQNDRVFDLINAAYRGVQDSRAAIRFFKRSATENDNPYSVDTSRITVWGVGTGGYISLASGTLDTITDTFLPKFTTQEFGSMINAEINGNVDGTTFGVLEPTDARFVRFGILPGDTLNIPNHVGYSSEFQLTVNMGGAMGDSSWIDANDPPIISFHVPADPFAPCVGGILNVPPPINLPIVEVFGSCGIQPIAQRVGINDVFDGIDTDSDISTIASTRNAQFGADINAFLPLLSDDPTSGGDWSYSNTISPYGIPDVPPCDTNSVLANSVLDSIMAYFTPRAYEALNLEALVTSVEVVEAGEIGLRIAPNPASTAVTFEVDATHPIQTVQLFDMSGRQVAFRQGINSPIYTLDRGRIPAGVYIARIGLGDRVAASRIVFTD